MKIVTVVRAYGRVLPEPRADVEFAPYLTLCSIFNPSIGRASPLNDRPATLRLRNTNPPIGRRPGADADEQRGQRTIPALAAGAFRSEGRRSGRPAIPAPGLR